MSSDDQTKGSGEDQQTKGGSRPDDRSGSDCYPAHQDLRGPR